MADVASGESTASLEGACLACPSPRVYALGVLWLAFGYTPGLASVNCAQKVGHSDCQPHGRGMEQISCKRGNVAWVRGSGAAGQSKQLMSSLMCLWLRLVGHDDFVCSTFRTVKMLSFIYV